MVHLSHPLMTTGKTIALTIQTFVSKVKSLVFNMQSRFVIAFLPRSKHLLISWLQSPSTVILEPKKRESVFISPFIYHEVMGPDAIILVFWLWNFKPAFSLSSFTFIKRFFSSSLLSAIRVVSSAYLRLLIFLPAMLILACAFSLEHKQEAMGLIIIGSDQLISLCFQSISHQCWAALISLILLGVRIFLLFFFNSLTYSFTVSVNKAHLLKAETWRDLTCSLFFCPPYLSSSSAHCASQVSLLVLSFFPPWVWIWSGQLKFMEEILNSPPSVIITVVLSTRKIWPHCPLLRTLKVSLAKG